MPQLRLNAALDTTAPPKVDRSARRINGVAVMTIGEALGHGFRLNDVSLANVLKLGQASKNGMKSRLSHPNACNDTTAKHLGRVINFRQDGEGEKVLADLQLAAASTKSPHGNLADYVMTLAEEDPEAFGMSMVVELQTETELDDAKQPKTDANGEPLLPFAIITKLKAVDVVGDPAANPGGMFSEGDNLDANFAKDASVLLDSLEAGSPEALWSRAEAFLCSYFSHRFGEVPQRLSTKGSDPMTAEQKQRAADIAALCTKYLGENDAAKTKAAAFAADEAATIDSVKDALLAELAAKANAKPTEQKHADLSDPVEAYKHRRTEIASLCVAALGDSVETRDRIEAFLNDPTISVEAVRNAMFGEMAAKLKSPTTGADPLTAGDKDAKRKAELEAEYDATIKIHDQLGMSKEEYVQHALERGDNPVVIIAPQTNA